MEMIVFVGLPGSGKSTFYQNTLSATHLRINLDMLRTRRRERAVIEACLGVGQRIVIDNTNPTPETRSLYLEMAKKAHFSAAAYHFDVPFEDCLERNARRDARTMVSEKGLKSVAKVLTPPQLQEGFREIKVIDLTGACIDTRVKEL